MNLPKQRAVSLFCLLGAILTVPAALAVSNQSLWADESLSAFFAAHARLAHLDSFPGIGGISNMPLYHLLLVPSTALFGDSESALRAFNVPFAFLFVTSILFLCRRSRFSSRFFVPLLFSVFPLLIYYTNESRPYAALLGLSCAATVSFLTYLDEPSRPLAWSFCLFSLASIGMHLFGALCPLALFIFVALRTDARKKLVDTWSLWRAPFLLIVAIGVFALLAYIEGGGISSHASLAKANPDIPINLPTSWRNLAFAVYESLGFSGLGPPRNDMRIHLTLATFLPYMGTIALGVAACVMLAALLVQGAESSQTRNARTLLGSSGLALLVMFAASRLLHFGFLGRHVMSLVGVVCCAIALTLIASKTRIAQPALAILFLAWGVSSVRLVTIYPYGKDDFRTALKIAKDSHLPILLSVNPGDPVTGYYDAVETDKLNGSWLTPAPLRSENHWRFVTPVQILASGSDEVMESEAASINAGRYILVTGKPDLADPTGWWTKRIAMWNPQLQNRLNGYQVLTVEVPRNNRQ